MKALVVALLLALLVASPVSAAKRPFIAVDQEQIIIGEWFTVTYQGSDYARATCTQDGATVWSQRVYLVGEGGPVQITPEIPYIAGTYTPCSVTLVNLTKRGEKPLASDTFLIRSPL